MSKWFGLLAGAFSMILINTEALAKAHSSAVHELNCDHLGRVVIDRNFVQAREGSTYRFNELGAGTWYVQVYKGTIVNSAALNSAPVDHDFNCIEKVDPFHIKNSFKGILK